MTPSNSWIALIQEAARLHQTGAYAQAETLYRQALALEPRQFEALRLLGGLYIQMNRPDDAIACLKMAAEIQPDNPELLTNLGVAYRRQSRFNDALAKFQRAVAVAPDYPNAVLNIGSLFFESGKLGDAIPWLERSLSLRPGNAEVHAMLADIFRIQEKDAAAVSHYRRARDLQPKNMIFSVQLANLLRKTGEIEEARALYEIIASERPDDMSVLLNWGTLERDAGNAEAALARYDDVLKRCPTSTEAEISRAGILLELDRAEEAYTAYDQSLRSGANLPDARWGKALAALALGIYPDAWALYEARFEYKQLRGALLFQNKRWDGSSFEGRRLLIWGEQGLGDVLQFIRYAALCKERGGTVLVLCRTTLKRLIANCPFVDQVLDTAIEADFDYQISVMSLPHVFQTTLETIPQNIPYLFVSEEARREWQPRFRSSKGFKVGLVWAGNPRKSQIEAHMTDRQRSTTLKVMRPLLEIDGCEFYSLQKDEAGGEVAGAGLQDVILDYMGDVEDMMDTAAIIENLDLVISVDTSVVHLAGGLGKPVWVLSRFGGCWRWLRNQAQSPWYPKARVFGQPSPGDWESCIAQAADRLREQRFAKGAASMSDRDRENLDTF